MIEQLVDVLPADGSEVSFDQFMTDARAAGARPENWLKAKRKGLIEARISDDGQHLVKRILEPVV